MARSLVIAATHSGSGKTSVSLALTRALTRRGYVVQTFKTGPDFLDPTYLALASGRPCHNLDGWMAGKKGVCRVFAQSSAGADIALIEGVMGLFDGADAEGDSGSTAEIAHWLDAPVLLVVDVHGMGRSLAALVQGFVNFAPELRFAGIIANHCGSERHAEWLAAALAAAGLPPLVGAIPRGAFPELPSRHLGLVTADPRLLPVEVLDALADALERHCAIETFLPLELVPGEERATAAKSAAGQETKAGASAAVASGDRAETPCPRSFAEQTGIDLARGSAPLAAAHARAVERSPSRKIGVALDAAFHFYYPYLFTQLAEAGAESVFFSPLTDRRLPDGIGALYLGGGYPEAHAEGLAANQPMIEAIRNWVAAGRPLYAECGGLMYLSQGLTALDGRFHSFLGVLPAPTRMLEKKKTLGYVEVMLTADSLWGQRGDCFRGHEFHYSELAADPVVADPGWQRIYALRRRRSAAVEPEGFQKGAVLASYAHLYYATQPAAISRFLSHCGGES